jgi:hypothetical protein
MGEVAQKKMDGHPECVTRNDGPTPLTMLPNQRRGGNTENMSKEYPFGINQKIHKLQSVTKESQAFRYRITPYAER